MGWANKVRPILAADVGVSLIFTQALAKHALTPELCLLDLAISHCVYGRDRFLDLRGENDFDPATPWPAATTTFAWVLSSILLTNADQELFVPILSVLVLLYKESKPSLGVFKPIFIGFLWSAAITFLPNDAPPLDSLPEFVEFAALYASASNIADIKDYKDDARNNITTIPVIFGCSSAYAASGCLASIALVAQTATTSINDYVIHTIVLSLMGFCGIKAIHPRPL